MEGKEQQRALNRLLQERAQRNLDKLDDLPDSIGGQIQELMDYDFMGPGRATAVPGNCWTC